MAQPTCFLALPSYGPIIPQCLFSVMSLGQKLQVLPVGHRMSDIDSNYSSLLCICLNNPTPFDYFAMLHSDIEPQPGWLDILYEEMQAMEADVISAVVPIKNDQGTT